MATALFELTLQIINKLLYFFNLAGRAKFASGQKSTLKIYCISVRILLKGNISLVLL